MDTRRFNDIEVFFDKTGNSMITYWYYVIVSSVIGTIFLYITGSLDHETLFYILNERFMAKNILIMFLLSYTYIMVFCKIISSCLTSILDFILLKEGENT